MAQQTRHQEEGPEVLTSTSVITHSHWIAALHFEHLAPWEYGQHVQSGLG